MYTKDQIEKLGNTLIYLCNKMSDLSKTHLLKLIFIIEESSIKNNGIPFFDLTFNVWKLGPVSVDLFAELSGQQNLLKGYVDKEIRNTHTYFISTKEFSDDQFSDNDMLLLDGIIKRFLHCSTRDLIAHTHKVGSPWFKAANKRGIYEKLERGEITTTPFEIEFDDFVENDTAKFERYNFHKEFLNYSKLLKA